MDTIDAFERDIKSQPEMIRTVSLPVPIPEEEQRCAVFAGSGDSLAAAMLAEAFSGGLARAADPRDVGPSAGHVYFVSVSGSTVANVRAAKRASESTAITANPGSRLARAAGRVIPLSPQRRPVTAGSVSFLESALVCMALVRRFRIAGPEGLLARARRDARVRVSKRICILGSGLTYPLAMYFAAKFYEVLGYDARYARTEQFSHMELFSAKRGDTVIILERHGAHSRRLAEGLGRIGLDVIMPALPGPGISQVLYCTFLAQHVVLYEARRRRRRDCHFVTARKIRGVSDDMIY